jgi:hypothetical protein
MARDDNEEESNVNPAKQGELFTQVLALEVGDKPDETDRVEHEADEAVISRKRDEPGVDEYDVFKVVDYRFAVEEVIGDDEKVPLTSATRT